MSLSSDENCDDTPASAKKPRKDNSIVEVLNEGASISHVQVHDGVALDKINERKRSKNAEHPRTGERERSFDKVISMAFPYTKDPKWNYFKEILDICIGGNVSDDKVCARVPAGITESGIFIVDLQAVCYKDLTVDDNGVYGSHSSPSEDFQVFFDDLGNISAVEKINKNDKETITKMLFANPENSRKRGRPSEPKLRTKPSVLWRMREMGSKSSAKQIINNIHREVGGVVSISSPSDIPKDRQQVYNQLRKVEGRKKSRSTGPAKSPDITKLLSLQQAGRFVRDVSLGARSKKNGEMRAAASTFAGTDTTIGWIKRFCCPGSTQAAVAGVDMTYKLGPFYLTTVTFPNPMFVYKNNVNKHPTTLAAVMTSVTKEKRDYEYFARSLKSEGIESLMYGTDGECALESGFESVYPIAESPAHNNIHLRCFDHAKGDILTN
ncbi:hypothetical protein OS493_033984 [Desmophyllum pertusum]|uniref:Uncharacterized protein n=1 Tax=Desmophyllum pertusum TaxID=174260 RepID=A0A9W9ZJD5_9CNID|nr:hypothetical protein OS493_033984 [Desmophyllum pertusum]